MKVLNKVFEGVNKAVGWLLILLFVTMTVAYFGQIVLRYAFDTGVRWTEELTRYCQVALIMFGAAMLAGKNGHINVSVLEALVPRSIRKWVIIGQQIVTGTFFAIAIKLGLDFMANASTQVSTNMRIPMMYVYMMFPIAFSILVFNVIVFILNTISAEDVIEEPDEVLVDLATADFEVPGDSFPDDGPQHHHLDPAADQDPAADKVTNPSPKRIGNEDSPRKETN